MCIIQLDENDPKRKEVLRQRVNDYIRRAETLKMAFVDGKDKRALVESKKDASLQRIPTIERSTAFTYNELSLYQIVTFRIRNLHTRSYRLAWSIAIFVYACQYRSELVTLPSRRDFEFATVNSQIINSGHEITCLSVGALSKSTTGMTDALEIGEVAEQYLAEGNYALALEKFQSCLSVLVPLLGKEPFGRRRDLLHKQVITINRNIRFVGRCTAANGFTIIPRSCPRRAADNEYEKSVSSVK